MEEQNLKVLNIPYQNNKTKLKILTFGLLASPLSIPLMNNLNPNLPMVSVLSLGGILLIDYLTSFIREVPQAKDKVSKVDVFKEYNLEKGHINRISRTELDREIRLLEERLNDNYVNPDFNDYEISVLINKILNDYLSKYTKQIVKVPIGFKRKESKDNITGGTCSRYFGDITIYEKSNLFIPQFLAHETLHKMGYMNEFDAQILSYLSMMDSNDEQLIQSALSTQLGWSYIKKEDISCDDINKIIENSTLRPELKNEFTSFKFEKTTDDIKKYKEIKAYLESRGQEIDDYHINVVDFLYDAKIKF
jgi:hypothetical protein